MKIGDRLLCIKTYYRSVYSNTPNFIEGKIYEVITIMGHICDENKCGLILGPNVIDLYFKPHISHKRKKNKQRKINIVNIKLEELP